MNIPENRKLKVLDLFCGCGGSTSGLTQAGLDVVCGIDVWDKAIENYSNNNNHLSLCKDLTQYPPEQFEFENKELLKNGLDIISASPPCQGLSIAGKRDKNDPRNSLFMEFVKYVNHFRPKAIIMENVIGLLSFKLEDGTNVIDLILSELNPNYNTIVCKLYASDFGVPQNRRRVIIIGIRKDLNITPTEPKPINTVENRKSVGSVLINRESVPKNAYLSDKAISGINRKKEESKAKGCGFGAQFLNLDKPSYTIPARYWKDGYDALVKYSDTEIRRLTVLELKRIQSFPDEYVFNGSKKDIIIQIGNAVAPKFMKEVGEHIKSLLTIH